MPHGEGVRKERPHLVPVRAESDRAQADQVAGREGARVRQQGQKHLLREPVPPLDVRELGREALGALRPGPDFCVKPSSCLGLLVAQRPLPSTRSDFSKPGGRALRSSASPYAEQAHPSPRYRHPPCGPIASSPPPPPRELSLLGPARLL